MIAVDTLPLGTRIWHRLYCRWYDTDRAGHRARARLWGALADVAVRLA